MPVADAYKDDSLDGLVGGWPSSGKWRLYSSDPSQETTPSDVELASDGGYAAVAYASTDWAASSGGSKAVASAISFGTSTDAYSDTATYYGITNGTDADDLVWSDDLGDDAVAVGESGTDVSISPSLSMQDGQ